MNTKTVAITGATSGIGRETAKGLFKQGFHLILLARNLNKARELRDQLLSTNKNGHIHIYHCNLADLNSVKTAADEIIANHQQLHILLNNAGGIFPKKECSEQGYEITFAVNHLGHFILTKKLLGLLHSSKAGVINVSSNAYKFANAELDDIMFEEHDYSAIRAYANAKLFNIWFTREIHQRYNNEGIKSFALHPGVVKTGFGKDYQGFAGFLLGLFRPFMISASKGAQTSLFLSVANDKTDSDSGKFFTKKHPTSTNKMAQDEKKARQLWDLSEKMISLYL